MALVAVLAAGYLTWFRNSSLVAVEEVTVRGISGPEEAPVEAALAEAALGMSTLNVDQGGLEAAVAGFPTVAGVSAEADFPHALTLRVSERPPVMLANGPGGSAPIAGDGTVLAGVEVANGRLPEVEVSELPDSGRVSGDALAIARTLGAAPGPLGELIRGAGIGPEGIEVELRGGLPVQFGDGARAEEKWAAAAAVLANPKIDALTYLDVRVPDRPAAGGAAPPISAETTETGEPEVAEVPVP